MLDYTISGHECSAFKPDPEIYLRAMEALGVEPAECLVIEDSPLEPETENVSAAVGCARLALRLAPNDAHTTRLLNKIHTTYPDAAEESDEHVMGELALQGVPTSPSAEIAICLIMCATDAASDGDKQEATRLTVRARDLVGEEACAAIIKLVRESDAELNAERKAKREAAGSNADGAKEAGDAQ